MPKVSVIIPVYNSQRYLRQCLDSVISQTLEDIEIICINDGSTDSSPEILMEYAAEDPRIIIIDKKNEGYGRGMNDALDIACGEYIGIVESDDFILPDMYEELYRLAKEKDLDIIKSDFYRYYDEDGTVKTIYEKLVKADGRYNEVIDPKEDVSVFKNMVNTWAGIYKRSFIEEHHIRHNTSPGASFQDNGFWFQTFAWAKRVYFIDKGWYMNRRDNPDSSVKQRDKVYCMNDEYKFIHDFLDANPPLKEKFIYAYSFKRARNYFWNYGRIAKEYKKEYLKTISREFRAAYAMGEVDPSYFTKTEWFFWQRIMKNPKTAYYWMGLRAFGSRVKEQLRKRQN